MDYGRLSVEEKCTIGDAGRPLPPLPQLTQSLKVKNRADSLRKFNVDYYKKALWV